MLYEEGLFFTSSLHTLKRGRGVSCSAENCHGTLQSVKFDFFLFSHCIVMVSFQYTKVKVNRSIVYEIGEMGSDDLH